MAVFMNRASTRPSSRALVASTTSLYSVGTKETDFLRSLRADR